MQSTGLIRNLSLSQAFCASDAAPPTRYSTVACKFMIRSDIPTDAATTALHIFTVLSDY